MTENNPFSHPDLDKGFVAGEPILENDWFVDIAIIVLLALSVGSFNTTKPLTGLDDLKERMGKVNERMQTIEFPKEVKLDEV